MKQPERVAELLAELRTLAENDFERHRIDVLEKDLTSPPVAEVIDEKHQIFLGITYRQIKSGHYEKNSYSLHRAIWTYYNGKIPNGYHIHHRDENPANNAIENLQCVSKAEHRALHNMQLPSYECICENCGAIYRTNNQSHNNKFCSHKCSYEWRYRNHLEERTCLFCGKKFKIPVGKSRQCCSRSCSSKLSYQNRCNSTAVRENQNTSSPVA